MRSGTIVSAKGIGLVLAVVQSGLTASLHSAEPDRLVLTENGRPKATIILAKEPTRAAQLAACELQAHIRLISEAVVPIVKGAEKAEGARILVGESEATRALGLRSADFQPQEFLVRFLPDTLLLLGRDKDDRGPVKYDFSDPLLYETWPDFYDVARELKKTHPDKYIITLAYMTHAAIPRLSTVIVRETRRKAVHSDTTGPSSQETR